MAAQPQQVQVQLPPTFPPPSAAYSSGCIVNRIGQSIFFDLFYIDPLTLTTIQSGTPVRGAHVGRIVMAEDAAINLRDYLIQLLEGK